MKLLTAQAMRRLDSRAIEAGMPGAVLMENAGRAVYQELIRRHPLGGRPYHIYCGTGNNGGDGFVVARLLRLAGADVAVTIAGDPARIAGDARLHHALMAATGVAVCDSHAGDAILVDALLGTGAVGAPRGAVLAAIEAITAAGGAAISVDIPSGVCADTGEVEGAAVRADCTVTFAYPKPGLALLPGRSFAGSVVVDPIGFPWETLAPASALAWLQAPDVRALFAPRSPDAHKGNFGHVLVLGGSVRMPGAPALTSYAALRAGAGLASAAVPMPAQPTVAGFRPEVMTMGLPTAGDCLDLDGAAFALTQLGAFDVVCIGPGGTLAPSAAEAMMFVARKAPLPVIIDADGLNALALDTNGLGDRTHPTIMTPHPGEAARLLGTGIAQVQSNRVEAVRELATRYRAIAVLKGAGTLVCDGTSNDLCVAVNSTGNPGMATAGSGDVLTGVIAALVAGGQAPWDAACAGVYLHGLAGDCAASAQGQAGLVAGDIVERLPEARQRLEAR